VIVQIPALTSVRSAPLTVQTVGVNELKLTARLEDAVALRAGGCTGRVWLEMALNVTVCEFAAVEQVGVPTVAQTPLVQERVTLPLKLAVDVEAVELSPLATPGMVYVHAPFTKVDVAQNEAEAALTVKERATDVAAAKLALPA
jgi:hypothetical protein